MGYRIIRMASAWFVAGLLWTAAGPGFGGTDEAILGTWQTADGGARIEIYPCRGGVCGRISWLREPNFPNDDDREFAGKPKVDRRNPDPSRRGEPILGKEILRGLADDGTGSWGGGEIYDTKSGTTYRCQASVTAQGTLELRGYVGISLFGRTSVWTRP